LAGFAVTLIHSMRGKHDLSVPIERLLIGVLALTYYPVAATQLEALSQALSETISNLGNRDDLRALLLNAFKKAATSPTDSGNSTVFNIPAVLEQAWRTGVWGVMTSLVEGVFLVVSFVLECAQEVLWKLLLFLFPLAAGAVPIFPRLLTNQVLYSVELSLWFPVLCMVELVTGVVAKRHLVQSGSWGLYLVGVEVVAILLILMIPTVTHRLLNGAFAGDFNAQGGVFVMVRKVVQVARPVKGGIK
jgi:hypothetical protein